MKAFLTALFVALLVFGGVLVYKKTQKQEVLQKQILAVKTTQSIAEADEKPRTIKFKNDADAVEALKRCEGDKIALTDCVEQLRKNYVVTGLVPEQVSADGFAGFMVFPLADGETLILDYNTLDQAKQFVYFGTFEELAAAAQKGDLDETLTRRVKRVKKLAVDLENPIPVTPPEVKTETPVTDTSEKTPEEIPVIPVTE